MLRHRPLRVRLRLRCLAVLSALAGVGVASLGVVMIPQPARDLSRAFPCEGGSCGCASAQECWQSCCCTTVNERLRWAEDKGIDLPFALLETLSEIDHATQPPRVCCSEEPMATGADLPNCAADLPNCTAPASDDAGFAMVLLSQVNRCRGVAAFMAIFGSAICEPWPELPSLFHPLVAWLHTPDARLESSLRSPPIPPPRLSA